MSCRDKSLAGKTLLIVVNTDWFFLSHRLSVAVAAKRAGMRVCVATRDTGRGHEIEAAGLEIHRLHFARTDRSPLKDLALFVRLAWLLRRSRPDVVHLVSSKAACLGGIAARICRVPLVVIAITGAGYAFGEHGRRATARVVELLLRMALGYRRAIGLFQQEEDLQYYLSRRIAAPTRCSVIRGQGVNINTWLPTPEPGGRPAVMFAARLIEEKGPRVFAEAAKILQRRGVDAEFVLVGPLDAEMPSAIANEELDDWIRAGTLNWWGPSDDMAATLAAATVFVFPSYHREGVPKTLIEAAASGRAIVATDIPGCREVVINDLTGILVPARNPIALADAIERLLGDGELRSTLGAEARRRVECHFTERSTVEATLALYRTGLMPVACAQR